MLIIILFIAVSDWKDEVKRNKMKYDLNVRKSLRTRIPKPKTRNVERTTANLGSTELSKRRRGLGRKNRNLICLNDSEIHCATCWFHMLSQCAVLTSPVQFPNLNSIQNHCENLEHVLLHNVLNLQLKVYMNHWFFSRVTRLYTPLTTVFNV